jgi:pyrimidine operon attenuation protein/uracil phosphoribosyltransferase
VADSGAVVLATAADVEVLLDRLAERMRPDVGDDTALIGIRRRGAPLAHRLAERLALKHGPPPVAELELKRYSDRLELLHERPRLSAAHLDIEVADRHLVLVDDVLYSGESLFRAACFLRERGAARLQVAVLCARGRATMPIRADYVGLKLDVGERWIIDCRVPPFEEELGVVLTPVPL